MSEPVFVDTWGWLARANARDQHHAAVVACLEELKVRNTRLVTSSFVVDELVTALFRRVRAEQAVVAIEALLEAARRAVLSLEWVGAEVFGEAWQLRRRLADKPTISFTDLTSVAIMRRRGITRVLSGDADFARVGLGLELLPHP